MEIHSNPPILYYGFKFFFFLQVVFVDSQLLYTVLYASTVERLKNTDLFAEELFIRLLAQSPWFGGF